MKREKAIETLTSLANRLAHVSQADEQAAVKLGIEALKREQEHQTLYRYHIQHQLPGETED